MYARPESDEYSPAVAHYVQLVPAGRLTDILHLQYEQSLALWTSLTEEQSAYSYAEGKWSIKTVVGHIADVERLWSYRILRIARGDARELPGYDRDIFAAAAACGEPAWAHVVEDYSAVRRSTLTLLRHLEGEALRRCGEFQEHPMSARAAACILTGHEIHHRNVVHARYLPALQPGTQRAQPQE